MTAQSSFGTVAVLLPSKGRSDQLLSNLSELMAQATPHDVKVYIVAAVQMDDGLSRRAVERAQEWHSLNSHVYCVLRPPDTTAVQGWNLAYEFARHTAGWFVLGADDIRWRRGWLDEALRVAYGKKAAVVGLNDGHTDLEKYAPHYMANSWFTERVLGGYMAPPVYRAWWFDREVCEKAQDVGRYAPAWGAHAEHRHPDWRTAQMDQTYLDAWPDHDIDKMTYQLRKADGFPVDYGRAVKGVTYVGQSA